MKFKTAKAYGIVTDENLDESYVDIGDLITTQCFNKKGDNRRYEDRAVEELIRLKIPFCSNTNITYNLFKKLLAVKCPYCNKEMGCVGSGGNASMQTMEYRCQECVAKINISLPPDGISVSVKNLELEKLEESTSPYLKSSNIKQKSEF